MRLQSLGVLLGLALASAPVHADPGQEYLATRIGWLAGQRAPGLPPLGPIQMGPPNRDGDSLDISVPLQAGRCYSFVGTSAPTVDDADMYLFSPDNQPIANDKSDGRDMYVLSCAKVTGPHRVELKLKDGRGDLALRVFVHGAAKPESPPEPEVAPSPPPPRRGKRMAQRGTGASGSPINPARRERTRKSELKLPSQL